MTSETEKPWWRTNVAVETYKTRGIAAFFFLFMPTLLFQPFRIPSFPNSPTAIHSTRFRFSRRSRLRGG